MSTLCCTCEGFAGLKSLGRRNTKSTNVEPAGMISWCSPVPRKPEAMNATVQIDRDGPARLWGALGNSSKFQAEQLMSSPGSLPKPMTAEQRAANIKNLQPTATYEMLAKLPADVLHSNSPETQDLRRRLVNGTTIVFISAGYPGKRFTFERAAALGIKAVIIDHPDSWSRGLVDEGIISKFLPLDMSQSSQDVYKGAEKLITELQRDGGRVDGIHTFVELSVGLAARLCETFGLPGPAPAAVDAARDKHQTRAALKKAGLPTPKNALIRQPKDLQVAGEIVGFPAVLKPVSGAGSLGVRRVPCMEELQIRYNDVVKELSSLVVSSGALELPDGSGTGIVAKEVVDLTVLLEQYLDGDEVDVDLVMSDGQWQYSAISDNGPTAEPFFNETWGVCPSTLPRQKQIELQEMAVRCVQVLGFFAGVFHVEMKYTTTGPQLVEVNARMGGGPVWDINHRVWGIDLCEEAFFIALGVPARPSIPTLPLAPIAYSFLNATRKGTVGSVECIEQLRGREGVVSCNPLVRDGEEVLGPPEGISTWLAVLVVTGPNPEVCKQRVLVLEKEVFDNIQIV